MPTGKLQNLYRGHMLLELLWRLPLTPSLSQEEEYKSNITGPGRAKLLFHDFLLALHVQSFADENQDLQESIGIPL